MSSPVLNHSALCFPVLSHPVLSNPVLSHAVLCNCSFVLSHRSLSYKVLDHFSQAKFAWVHASIYIYIYTHQPTHT